MAFEIFNWKPNMWLYQRGRAKAERNRAVFADRQAGMSYSQLGKKHGLHTMTCFNICRREAAKELALPPPPPDPQPGQFEDMGSAAPNAPGRQS